MVPVWYEGEQLPPSLKRTPKKRGTNRVAESTISDEDLNEKGVEGDVELEEEERVNPPRWRRSKRKAALKNDIINQFANARTKIQGLNPNFYQQVQDDNTKMTEAYDALQAAVVLLKVDMVSAFSVSIDYVDADGD